MSLPQAILLALAAALGGGLNAVAGGGSFITFPALIFTGVPSIQANASSTVALWPASLVSSRAFGSPRVVSRVLFVVLIASSVAGGAIGALVLLHTPQRTFLRMIPYLLLVATVLFAFGRPVAAWVRRRSASRAESGWRTIAGTGALQFVVAVYGGFFGGGVSIVILSVLSLLGLDNIHSMNALKNLLTGCINGMAVIIFVALGAVWWSQALVMLVGAVVGGYGGAKLSQRFDPELVRRFVVVVGLAMALYFFIR